MTKPRSIDVYDWKWWWLLTLPTLSKCPGQPGNEGLWAQNWNLVKKKSALIFILMIQSVTILHMPQQLSCCGMCKIVILLNDFLCKSYMYFHKILIMTSKIPRKLGPMFHGCLAGQQGGNNKSTRGASGQIGTGSEGSTSTQEEWMIYTENWELSWCQRCGHWQHWRLSLWPATIKLSSWQLSSFHSKPHETWSELK